MFVSISFLGRHGLLKMSRHVIQSPPSKVAALGAPTESVTQTTSEPSDTIGHSNMSCAKSEANAEPLRKSQRLKVYFFLKMNI